VVVTISLVTTLEALYRQSLDLNVVTDFSRSIVMKSRIAAKASKRKNERGNVVAYTVLSALFLFLAVGLGVDLSRLYLVKAELQNAADAGALGGGYALGEVASSPSSRITTAVDRAVSIMNQNKWGFDNKTFVSVMSLTDQRTLVTLAKNLNGSYVSETTAQTFSNEEKLKLRFIRVATPSVPVTSIFALPILGTKNISANATAGMSVAGNVRFCPAPIAAVAPDPNNPFPANFEATCPGGLVPFDDDDNSATPNCDPTINFCKKCSYRIKQAPQGQNEGGPSPGNFGYLECGGPGAQILEENLASYGDSCRCGNISPGDNVTVTKTGQNTGPAETGLNTRFNLYANSPQAPQYPNAPPDTNVYGQNFATEELTWQQYKAGSPMLDPATQTGGHVGEANRRVLVIPMISYSNWPNGGSGPAQVAGFGGFFMKKAVDGNSDIVAEFIGDEITSVVGYDPGGPSPTNIVTVVLYK
jgi:Flp pilus assembly protein TadG